MKPYLIQRAKFQNECAYSPNRKGIDSMLCFDYMNSAEFELGALTNSLIRIRKQISKYLLFEYIINSKTITIFCKKENETEICTIINDLADNKFYLKEYCDFQHFIYFAPQMLKSDFWWDIKNDYMF